MGEKPKFLFSIFTTIAQAFHSQLNRFRGEVYGFFLLLLLFGLFMFELWWGFLVYISFCDFFLSFVYHWHRIRELYEFVRFALTFDFPVAIFFLIDSFIWIISLIQNYYACAHWFRVSACKQFFSLSFFNLHIERWGIKRMSTQLIGLLTVYVNQMVFPWILIFGHPFFSVQNYDFFYSIRNTRQITFLPIC